MDFIIGLSIGVAITILTDVYIIRRANTTLRTLHHECGMAAEAIKYSEHSACRRLKSAMSYAGKRHSGLRFVEQYTLKVIADDHEHHDCSIS